MYSRRRRNPCHITLREALIACFAAVVFLAILLGYYNQLQSELQIPHPRSRLIPKRYKPHPCDLVHIGMVCVTHESKLRMYTMLKSLFHYRKSNPIQFYIVVHPKLKYSLTKLFETWALPEVKVKFYLLEDVDPLDEFTDAPSMLRGFAEVVLYHLDHLRKYGWNKIWKIIEEQQGLEYDENSQIQLIFDYFAKSRLAYALECFWNAMSNTDTECIEQNKVVHQETLGREDDVELMKGFDGNVVRELNYNCSVPPKQKMVKRLITDECSSFPESEIQQKRTLLYFFEDNYKPLDSDVLTLATQLSFDKFELLEEIANRWKGPMSITFYLTDKEFIKCIDAIESSYILKDRLNIGFHVVFKYGKFFHLTYLRNVALNEVKTPYVFSTDIDLFPMENLYSALKKHLSTFPNMTKKALVVPAFETSNAWTEIPSTKQELLELVQVKKVFIAQEDSQPEGHTPTDYTKWRNATKPYKVTWKNMYEPYVVVKSDVVRYDERFFAYGLDKVSHIMELAAQGYEFHVLPNTFVVHEYHTKSEDKNYQIFSIKYKYCLKAIQKEAAQDLKNKYGGTFLIK